MYPKNESHRLRILYLITKSNFGGAQRYVFDLALGSSQKGASVLVVAGEGGELLERLEARGIRTTLLPSLIRDVHGIRNEYRAFRQIIDMFRRERPDVIHLNSSKAGIMGALAGRFAGVPRIIFTAHGWAFNENRPWWQRVIIKFLHYITVLLSHETIAVSEAVKTQMNWPFAGRKMHVIYNGRTVPVLHSYDEARALLIHKYPVLAPYKNDYWTTSLAELHPTKQHDVQIRAMHEITRTYPNVRHIIMGEGEERQSLESCIKNHGLTENVFLLGNVPDAAQYLRAFAYLVLSSRTEALPYVPIEACIAGIPTVASGVGGIPEIIRNGEEGILVSPGDHESLALAQLHFIEDEAIRMGMARSACERAGMFSIDEMVQNTYRRYCM